MTRTRRSLYAVGASYLYTGVALVSGLVATPLLLMWLGEERIGVYKAGQQWLGYALLLGVGLDNGLAVHFARAAAAHDRRATAAIARAGIRAYVRVVLGSMLWCGVLLAFAGPLFNLHDPALRRELHIGLLLVLAGQAGLLFAAFKPLTDADQRGYVTNIGQAIAALLSVSVALLLAWQGFGLAGQFLALALTPIALGLMLARDAVRRYPELLHRRSGPRYEGIRSFDSSMLAVQVCGRVCFLSDSILIVQFLGPAGVMPYTSTIALIALLTAIVNGVGNSTWAALANLHNSGLHEAFNHRLVQLTRFVSLFSCALVVPVIAWNRDFVLAWLGQPNLYAGDALTVLGIASSLLMIVNTLWCWPLLTTGRVRKVLPLYLTGLAVHLAVSFAGTFWLGVIGPQLGVIANLGGVALWWCPRVLAREFGTSPRKLLAAAIGPWLLAVPFAGLLLLVAGQCSLEAIFPQRLLRMGCVAIFIGVSAIVYLAVALYAVLPLADRQEWLARLLKRKAA